MNFTAEWRRKRKVSEMEDRTIKMNGNSSQCDKARKGNKNQTDHKGRNENVPVWK